MLGFIYLVLILGWILVVLFLRCKKSISPHLSLGDNYPNTNERRPSIHVIELPPDDFRHDMDSYSPTDRSRLNSNRSSSLVSEGNIQNFPTDAIINPGFSHEDENNSLDPPPTYDEVMRQPENYPRVKDVCKFIPKD